MSYQRGGRRGRGGRGKRFYGGGGYQGQYDNEWGGGQYDADQRPQTEEDGAEYRSNSRGRGNQRPPGLKGKEIGMWYAMRSRGKKKQREIGQRPVVAMQGQTERKIRNLLDNIEVAENILPQPRRSGASLDDEDIELEYDNYITDNTKSPKDQLRIAIREKCQGKISNGVMLQQDNTGVHTFKAAMDAVEQKGEPTERAHTSNRPHQSSSDRPHTAPHSSAARVDASWDSWENQPKSSSLESREQDVEPMDEKDVSGVPNLHEVREYELEEMDLDLSADIDNLVKVKEEQDNTGLDDYLREQQRQKMQDKKYTKMMDQRKRLPSYNMRQKIIDIMNSSQVMVISGETGCGKTTQVPQFILDDFIERGQGSKCRLICTQPRRISAISVAERVADERAEPCGEQNSVGYSIRLERKLPRTNGSILYCTTGILLKYLESDPTLNRASHIVIDEIHERDLLSDFLMIILKDLLPKRPDLKLILMSATLNAEQFSRYYYNCPIINIPGFTYPVKEYYLEDAVQLTGFVPQEPRFQKKFNRRRRREELEKEEEEEWNLNAWARRLRGKYSDKTIKSVMDMHKQDEVYTDLIYELIRHISFNMEDGAILVFVPGWAEIKLVNDALNSDHFFRSDKFKIIPLHSLMPTLNQKDVFNRPPDGVRKIVIATNIAETSITIDDVVFVIDCGKIKVKDFDPENNMASLQSKPVSKANAKQRRGRAGRVQPGHCYHLFSSYQETQLQDYLPPEILRTPLEELCLQIKLLKLGKIEPFVNKAMQQPSTEALHLAITTLQDLQALDEEENLLPLGYHLARMPVDPHSGKMILFAAMFGCLDPVCIVAASLSFKFAFYVPLGKEAEADRARKELAGDSKSDHLMLINAFKGWEKAEAQGYGWQYCQRNFLSVNTLRMLKDMKKQFADLLHDLGFIQSRRSSDPAANVHSSNDNLVKAIICAGLYPNVAKVVKPANPRKHKPPSLKIKDSAQKGILVHPSSVNCTTTDFESNWLIYHKLMKTSNVFVYDCSMVSPYPLLFFGGKIGMTQQEIENEQKSMVTVDDWISFFCSDSTTQIVKDLRHQLDRILEEKITRTGVTNWSPKSREGAILKAIIDLITTEEVVQYKPQDSYDHHGNKWSRHRRH